MKRLAVVFLGLVGALSIVASGGGGGGGGSGPVDTSNTLSYDGTTLTFNLDLPPSLADPAIDDLSVTATLSGGSDTPLVVDAANDVVTGQITNVVAGTYQLQLVYFKDIDGIDTTLATFTKSITLVSGKKIDVTIADNDLDKDIDDDGDGYTNLAELRINTDPHDQYNTPATLPIFTVGNGSYGKATSTSYAMKSTAGEALAGTATSTNYKVTAGFTNY